MAVKLKIGKFGSYFYEGGTERHAEGDLTLDDILIRCGDERYLREKIYQLMERMTDFLDKHGGHNFVEIQLSFLGDAISYETELEDVE